MLYVSSPMSIVGAIVHGDIAIEKNPVSEGYIAVVRSCYLGPGSHEELKDINSENWWRNHKAEERRLPMAGRWAPQNHPTQILFLKGHQVSTGPVPPFICGTGTILSLAYMSFGKV